VNGFEKVTKKDMMGRTLESLQEELRTLKQEVWRAHMLAHPKKDDLADSFLQGLWVLEHEKK
jgi:hypothetical protein